MTSDMTNDGGADDETPRRGRRAAMNEAARAADEREASLENDAKSATDGAADVESDEDDEESDEFDSGSTFDADAFEGVEPVGLPRSDVEVNASAGESEDEDDYEDRHDEQDRDAANDDSDDEESDGARAEDDDQDEDDAEGDENDDGDDADSGSDEAGEQAAGDGAAGEGGEGAEGEDGPRGRRRRRRGRGRRDGRDDRDGRDGREGRGNRDDRSRRTEDRRMETKQEDRRGIMQLMVVNDVPDDECRIAILENGRVEALFMERYGATTNVGNIYKGRVTNVEPAIQAAFVDFGEGASGFLHVSDLHPKYFPGRERTERVGRKIPRRERPLIQEALKKGQEVLVQVLKEGISNKGPTLTSYLSIPGRLMVMMPDMDRVGVSRKVEDEDQRRAMRKILDQLDLPEGFGFILRTAGFDKTKTELSRDLAYLTRLWAVMKKRMDTTGAPCLLYSEGDLLIRTIRDMADENVEGIVVDSEDAFRKATAFLQVVSPRSAPRVLFWDRPIPLFHNFDVERQIHELHSRIVPLPSGGALVIDQTEALVAIDVNSGRSRSARDSETNAYQTNVEAVEEIARQLRLRDLGGVIVNDLIDMRSPRHRREIEDRFRNALKRDRAKSTVVPISEFGVLEMTRQRMRPSVRRAHFMDCPHCQGLGEIRKPETVAADQLRQVEFLLTANMIHRVEMVCSVRVASVLLSAKRRALYDVERNTGKRIDVRISEAIPIDRVDIYAYDERGADVELDRLPRLPKPVLEDLPLELPERSQVEDRDEDDGEEEESERGGGGRRRRRRRRKSQPADTTAMILSGTFDDLPDAEPDEDEPTVAEAIEEERRQRREETQRTQQQGQQARQAQPGAAPQPRDGDEEGEPGEGGRRRRRRRRGRGRGRDGEGFANEQGGEQGSEQGDEGQELAVVEAAPPPPPPPPSDPMAVYLLAKELSLTSKEILAKLAEHNVEVKSHMSKLTGEQVDMVKAWYAPPPPPPPPAPVRTAAPAKAGDEDRDGAEGEEGEGGGRRRRRRRRRGRGRGRDGEEGGTNADGTPSAPGAPRADGDDQADGDEGDDEGPEASGDEAGDGPARDGEAGEAGEGGRRRRRRRRGRGRGRDGERDGGGRPNTAGAAPAASGGAPPRGNQPAGDRRPPREDRGPRTDRPEGRGGNRDRDRNRNRDGGESRPPRPAAPAPEPKPDPMPQPPAAPKVRSLYGGRIRKLTGPKAGGGGGGDDE